MILAATAAFVGAAPAYAAIFTYNQTNGDVLTINTDTQTGTLVGANINTTFTSDGFATFTGGANPSGTFHLSSVTGTRTINGQTTTPFIGHVEELIISSTGRTNLWTRWRTASGQAIGGDYITTIGTYTPPPPTTSTGGTTTSSTGGTTTSSTGGTNVPAPGMLALFALGAGGLAWRRRRASKAA